MDYFLEPFAEWSGFGASLVAQTVKNLSSVQETRFDPWVGKIPSGREWQPTPVFLPGEFHGQRSLAGYGSWGCKELDTTERLSFTRFPGSATINYRWKYLGKM